MSAPDTLIHGLTQDAADILLHTSTNGRYVVGPESANEFALIQRMVEAGLLEDCGPQRIAGGATAERRALFGVVEATLPPIVETLPDGSRVQLHPRQEVES